MKKWRHEAFDLILRGIILLFHFKHRWYQFNTRIEKCMICDVYKCEVDGSHEWLDNFAPFVMCLWCQTTKENPDLLKCGECGNKLDHRDDIFCSEKCWLSHVGTSTCDCGNCIECGEIILDCGCLGECTCND